MMQVPEQYRIQPVGMMSSSEDGNNGCFLVPFESNELMIIASDGFGWEHVSVSLNGRTPNWREMCYIKDLFWQPEDCVVQYHPRQSEYVNNHPYCLHLWRSTKEEFPQPPGIFVGVKNDL